MHAKGEQIAEFASPITLMYYACDINMYLMLSVQDSLRMYQRRSSRSRRR